MPVYAHLHTKCHMAGCSSSLVITIKVKPKQFFAELPCYLQCTKTLPKQKLSIFPSPLSMHLLKTLQ